GNPEDEWGAAVERVAAGGAEHIIETAAVERRTARHAAQLHVLGAAAVHDRSLGETEENLRAAAVEDRGASRTAGLHHLEAAVDDRAACRAEYHLRPPVAGAPFRPPPREPSLETAADLRGARHAAGEHDIDGATRQRRPARRAVYERKPARDRRSIRRAARDDGLDAAADLRRDGDTAANHDFLAAAVDDRCARRAGGLYGVDAAAVDDRSTRRAEDQLRAGAVDGGAVRLPAGGHNLDAAA